MKRFGALAVVALALGAPAAAQAQSCPLPKGVHTANAQLQYDLTLEAGLIQAHTRDLLAEPSTRAARYVSQTVTSGQMLGGALGRYAGRVVTAVLTDPPSCGSARRR